MEGGGTGIFGYHRILRRTSGPSARWPRGFALSRQYDRRVMERSRLESRGKVALWEEPTRTVFVRKVPGVTRPVGVCQRPVDFSSVYPTLCELTGLPLPDHLDGQSIKPLLKDPETDWALPAITTHGLNNH